MTAGRWSAIGAAALLASSATATILNFEGNVVPASVHPTYGDRAMMTPQDGFNYEIGNGWTPNVLVDFYAVDADDRQPVAAGVGTWGGGYGDLEVVAFPGNSSGVMVAVTFIPDPGFGVRLNSFDAACFGPDQEMQPVLVEVGGVIVQDLSAMIEGRFPGDPSHTPFSSGVFSSRPVTLYIADNFNVGIDNINFDQYVVPGGDVDDNCVVDLDDLLVVLANYGSEGGPSDGDLDGSGFVDLDDLLIVLASFGEVCS